MLVLVNTVSWSATFTAVSSGSWNSSLTWGGTIPSTVIISDHIVIPVGITVTVDKNVSINGPLAQLLVTGNLTSTTIDTLTVNSGTLMGVGTVKMGTVILNGGGFISFSGQLTAGSFSSSSTNLQLSADVMVNNKLSLSGGVLGINSGGSVSLAPNATIELSGAQIALSGGTLDLSVPYNVIYTKTTMTAGPELQGTGLNNVTVDVLAGNKVYLNSKLAT
jgi:hypothetical protein